jgi:hypothetical protein
MVPLVAYKRQRKPSSGRWLSFALILESFIDGTLLACNIPCRFEFFSYATLNKKSEPPQRGVGYYALVAQHSINLCVFAILASRFNHSSDLLVGGKKHRQLARQRGSIVRCFLKLSDPHRRHESTTIRRSSCSPRRNSATFITTHTLEEPVDWHAFTRHRESFHVVCHSTDGPHSRRVTVYATPPEEHERWHEVWDTLRTRNQAMPIGVFLPPASKIE